MGTPEIPEIPDEDIGYYLDKSPLFSAFMAHGGDSNLREGEWLELFKEPFQRFQEDLEQKIGVQKNLPLLAVDRMIKVQEVLKSEFSYRQHLVTTSMLVGIGYELVDSHSIGSLLALITDQLIDVGWVDPYTLETDEKKVTLVNLVSGCLTVGWGLRVAVGGEVSEDLPSPFKDFFNNLGD